MRGWVGIVMIFGVGGAFGDGLPAGKSDIKLPPPATSIPKPAPAAQTAADKSTTKSTGLAKLRREGGKLVELPGVIASQSGRLVFTPTDGSLLLVLQENQLLERIDVQRERESKSAVWIVTGQVHEYRGANYLLLERAALQRTASVDLPTRR